MGAVRLAWKLQRWELDMLIAFVVVLVVALVVIGWRMEQIQAAAPECWQRDTDAPLPATMQDTCRVSLQAHSALRDIGAYAAVGSTLAPFLLGVVLGPPLVGREIEGRTAGIAWTLSRSRRRWLVLRAGPVVGLVLVATVLIGLAATALARQLAGGEPSFGSLVTPLPLPVGHGALALSIGLLAGVVVGRTFAAVLATALAVVLLMAGMSIGIDAWMAAEARPIPQFGDMAGDSNIYHTGLRDLSSGEVITLQQYFASDDVDEAVELPPPGMTLVAWRIPAADYPIWLWRETAALSVVTMTLAALFVSATKRRAP
jgi:hypothetical protein